MTSAADHRFDPAHIVTHDAYGGSCKCGKVFRTSTRFGSDAVRGNNLARANATKHEQAAARRFRAANPLSA